MTNLKAENWTLKLLLADKTEQVNRILSSQNIDLELLQELNNREEQIKELTIQLKLARDELAGSEVSAVAAASTILDNDAEATLEHSSLHAKIEKLEKENDELKQELRDLANNADSLANRNQELQERIRLLESKTENSPEMEKLARECNQLKEENQQLQNENADLLEKLEHANDIAYDANDKKQKAQDNLIILLNGIGEQDIDAALTALDTNKQIQDDLRAEAEDLTRQIDELQAKLEKEKNENKKIQAELKDSASKARALEARMERRSAQTSPVKNSPDSQFQKRILELENQLKEANYDRNRLRRRLEAAEAEIELLNVGDNSLKTRSKSVINDVESLQNQLLRFGKNTESYFTTANEKLTKATKALSRISQKIPILIARKNVLPLANLRKAIVEFIGMTSDMMQDLHDGANACIRAASGIMRSRKGILPVPLTREERGCLIELETKYDMSNLINPNSFVMDADELKSTELSGMAFSPIAKKGRFTLRNTKYRTATELVRMKDDIHFLGQKLQILLQGIWEQAGLGTSCPNVSTLIQTRNYTETTRAIEKALSLIRGEGVLQVSPQVLALIRDIRNDVRTCMETMNDDRRLLLETLQ